MKWAVKDVIMYKKFVKAVAREYSLRLETLRRNVILARQVRAGVEKKLGRPTVLTEEASAVDTSVLQKTTDEPDGNATFREIIAVLVMGSQAHSLSLRKHKVGHACVLTQSPYKKHRCSNRGLLAVGEPQVVADRQRPQRVSVNLAVDDRLRRPSGCRRSSMLSTVFHVSGR